MKLLVTGAAGFSIGSTYVRLVKDEHDVVVLDKLTYAGRRENLLGVTSSWSRARSRTGRSCRSSPRSRRDRQLRRRVVRRPLTADQDAFARTHVIGTSVLLDAACERGVGCYLQVSTDEVYGSIPKRLFTESSPLDPSSPYSATKAGGDLLVSAYAHTYVVEA